VLVSQAPSCDLWDGERIEAPPHSRLYHLEPVGVGSPMVESLTSYLTRLAEAHSLHLRTLVTDEILPRLHQSHLYRDGRPTYDHLTRFWKQSVTLNGTSATSNDWVQALEQLTLRRDLRFLTMLTWAPVLSSRALLRRTQAWCPVCYEEWRESGQVIYQPLLWALEVIRVCPYHGLRLHLHCPYADCGNEYSALVPHSQTGYCPRCERWLGNPFPQNGNGQGLGVEEQEWQQWVGTVVGGLLVAAPDFPVSPHQEVIAATITSYVQAAMEGNFSAFARHLQIHRRTAWEWGQGLQVPQLDALLQLCSYFGTSPVRFLTGHALGTTPVLQHAPEEKTMTEKPKKRFRKLETERLRCALEGVLQEEENPPPSMREVAGRLQYDSSHLYKHFPDLCRAIAARCRAHQKEQRHQRLQRICDEVKQTAQTLRAQGRIPSERNVGKMLLSRGVLKEREVRAALYNMRREERWKP
jgi:TniQ